MASVVLLLSLHGANGQECVIHGGLSRGMLSDACGGGQRSGVNVRLGAGFNAGERSKASEEMEKFKEKRS